uniref:Uncharacterized protein n=1 Tax=Arundo donax TaxID=35708 RepID=A0A0A9DSU6_ARUDO
MKSLWAAIVTHKSASSLCSLVISCAATSKFFVKRICVCLVATATRHGSSRRSCGAWPLRLVGDEG